MRLPKEDNQEAHRPVWTVVSVVRDQFYWRGSGCNDRWARARPGETMEPIKKKGLFGRAPSAAPGAAPAGTSQTHVSRAAPPVEPREIHSLERLRPDGAIKTWLRPVSREVCRSCPQAVTRHDRRAGGGAAGGADERGRWAGGGAAGGGDERGPASGDKARSAVGARRGWRGE
jgi:hypothetical protein